MKLKNKVAIVTGGGTGVGRGITFTLAKEGVKVVIAQPQIHIAQKVAKEVLKRGGKAVAMTLDLRDRNQIKELVERVIREHKKIDILVNNSAVTGMPANVPFLECSEAKLDEIIDVNLKGTFLISQAAARYMVERKKGVIINISSVSGMVGEANATAYCASKGGIELLTRAMALDLSPFGIRVISIAPGYIETKLNKNLLKEFEKHNLLTEYVRKTPLGRHGSPEEIGTVVAFLASTEASFITGTTVTVDGGYLCY